MSLFYYLGALITQLSNRCKSAWLKIKGFLFKQPNSKWMIHMISLNFSQGWTTCFTEDKIKMMNWWDVVMTGNSSSTLHDTASAVHDCREPTLATQLPNLPFHFSFAGEHCELNVSSGRCVPGVCKNGGECVNRLAGGFMCRCPTGEYEKPYCEMTTRSFPGQSFVTFRGLRQRFHFTVSFTWVLSFLPLVHFLRMQSVCNLLSIEPIIKISI